MSAMDWVFLSPHFDDAALSCGGLAWELAQAGLRPSVWTVCAGDPPPGPLSEFAQSLHDRWNSGLEATRLRRQEDIESCTYMAASYRRLPVPDCIYRQAGLNYWAAGATDLLSNPPDWLYDSHEAIFGPIHPAEKPLVAQLALHLGQDIPAQSEIVCPLAIGGHVDHRLTRAAAESLGRSLWYYPDYPYVAQTQQELDDLQAAGWAARRFAIRPAGMAAWGRAVAAHKSQISTFWPDLGAMQAALEDYRSLAGGAWLWRPGTIPQPDR
jgi:LmbE family N-acetylglucosaminyl deacetylase